MRIFQIRTYKKSEYAMGGTRQEQAIVRAPNEVLALAKFKDVFKPSGELVFVIEDLGNFIDIE